MDGARGISRRLSARAVTAVNEAFPITPSPSPLIAKGPNVNSSSVKPVIRRAYGILDGDEKESHAPPSQTTAVTRLLAELRLHDPVPIPVDHLQRLPLQVLAGVMAFVGNTFTALAAPSRTCRALRTACVGAVTSVVMVTGPSCVPRISAHGAMAGMADLLSTATHGQHITEFSVFRSKDTITQGASQVGPVVHALDLIKAVTQLPRLTFLDLRGVVLRNYASWSDHALFDLASNCAKLQVLRIGVVFMRAWEPQWWAPLVGLKELVVGSRREDSDWVVAPSSPAAVLAPPVVPATSATSHAGASPAAVDAATSTAPAEQHAAQASPQPATAASHFVPHVPPQPLALPDDFWVMLRTLPIATLKLWCPLTTPALQLFVTPTAPFPAMQNLALNLSGNTHIKPIEEPPKEDPSTQAAGAKKADPKAKAKTQDEQAAAQRSILYPALTTFTMCDVRDRPELVTELMVRMPMVAPQLLHINVANSNRQVPKYVPPGASTTRPVRGALPRT